MFRFAQGRLAGSAEPERNRQRDGAAQKAHRVDHDDRYVADEYYDPAKWLMRKIRGR